MVSLDSLKYARSISFARGRRRALRGGEAQTGEAPSLRLVCVLPPRGYAVAIQEAEVRMSLHVADRDVSDGEMSMNCRVPHALSLEVGVGAQSQEGTPQAKRHGNGPDGSSEE